MEQLPSSNPGPFRLWLTGLVRSGHSLLIWMGVICVVLFALARAEYPLVANAAGVVALLLVLIVACRFAVKGPEREQGSPTFTFSNNHIQVVNVNPGVAESLIRFAIEHREPLPPATGVIEGRASDPSARRLLSREESLVLQEQDRRLPSSTEPN